jgi:hypothetical protein
MLLIAAPTPLFNNTLENNLDEIRHMLRLDRLPRSRVTQALSGGWLGLGIYLAVAALLYALLDPAFPGQDGLLLFVSALVGLAVATAAISLTRDRYVWTRFKVHGTIKIAQWTLVLAAACVLITRLTGVQPGYVYGIVATVAFAVPLARADEGRMAWLGALALLVMALAAWFLRIPVQPTVDHPVEGLALLADRAFVAIFVTGVEGLVFGLIPIRFMIGEPLASWHKWRWLALWGAGILLFAHVILYPVSDYQPNPSAVGLWTVAITVIAYSAVAVGFWWYFRQRDERRRREEASGGMGGGAAGGGVSAVAVEPGGDTAAEVTTAPTAVVVPLPPPARAPGWQPGPTGAAPVVAPPGGPTPAAGMPQAVQPPAWPAGPTGPTGVPQAGWTRSAPPAAWPASPIGVPGAPPAGWPGYAAPSAWPPASTRPPQAGAPQPGAPLPGAPWGYGPPPSDAWSGQQWAGPQGWGPPATGQWVLQRRPMVSDAARVAAVVLAVLGSISLLAGGVLIAAILSGATDAFGAAIFRKADVDGATALAVGLLASGVAGVALGIGAWSGRAAARGAGIAYTLVLAAAAILVATTNVVGRPPTGVMLVAWALALGHLFVAAVFAAGWHRRG